ncbi:MAG TPA: hypothetical protein VLQ78_12015 [Ornithinibacter sp.]|nr:hypothetical protein [Ornithinibacter sp.]
MTRVLLLPSPLLPRLLHLPFLQALGARLWAAQRVECSVDVATFPPDATDAQDVLAAFRRSVLDGRPDLVVTHSNAGRYAALAAPGIPVVHVDAALPAASGDELPMAPAVLLDRLADLADDDGLLPPWSRWWPEEGFAQVLPDAAARAHLREHERRMPLSYFRSRLGAPPGWTEQPQAYLAFGGTYAEETALARRLGWPTTVLEDALHLHQLVDPDAVATAVLGLAALLDGSIRSAPGRGATTTG